MIINIDNYASVFKNPYKKKTFEPIYDREKAYFEFWDKKFLCKIFDHGIPVLYKGVQVGSVSDIGLHTDYPYRFSPEFRYASDHTVDFLGDELMGTCYFYNGKYESEITDALNEGRIKYNWDFVDLEDRLHFSDHIDLIME